MDKIFTISITLSITNSLHLSRFSAYLLANLQEDICRIWLWDLAKTDHTLCCAGSRILLHRGTDITASGYRYYCVGIQILLRRDTDITASGYRYYCVGLQILLRRVTDITASGYGYYCVRARILLRRLAQTYP